MFVSFSYYYKSVERESLILVKYIKRLDGAAGHGANIIFYKCDSDRIGQS